MSLLDQEEEACSGIAEEGETTNPSWGAAAAYGPLFNFFFFLISYSFIPLCKVLEISNLKFCFFILELAKEL